MGILKDYNIISKCIAELPAGNIDILRCEHGTIYVVGWAMFNIKSHRPAKVFLCPEGKPKIELPVIPQCRNDVNDFLNIPNDLITGFSTLVSLGAFSLDNLPPGPTNVVIVDSVGNADNIHAGKINIKWPEGDFFHVSKDIKQAESTRKVYENSNWFKRIWYGVLGSDTKLAELMVSASLTAKAIYSGSQLIKEQPKLALSMTGFPAIRLAQRMRFASENRGLIIIFDHDYGGGANTFSKNLISQHIAGKNDILRIWYQPKNIKFVGSYITVNERFSIDMGTVNDVFKLCTEFPSFAVQVNSLWGYPQLREILDNLLRLKLCKFTERIEFFAHDHMGICPSLFLLNHELKYCGVPELATACNKCLKNNSQDFKIFFHDEDIDVWRKSWQSFLLSCDVIRFFSNSTNSSYIRAYPWLDNHPNTIVLGHEVKDLWAHKIAVHKKHKQGLNIGVFGYINLHKGSQIVWDVANNIKESEDESSIYVFGSLDGKSEGTSGPVKVMGNYKPEQLVELCELNEIDLALVPSICPETFSITTKELILIGLPIVSFDLGAQEELLINYDKGYILELETEKSVYSRLISIYDNM